MISVVPKQQFNITLPPEVRERLDELAVEFQMEKATKVGAKIISTYIERWAILERRRREWEDEQQREMLERIDQEMRRRPPLMKGAARKHPTERKRQK